MDIVIFYILLYFGHLHHYVNSAFHPSGVGNRVPAFGWG